MQPAADARSARSARPHRRRRPRRDRPPRPRRHATDAVAVPRPGRLRPTARTVASTASPCWRTSALRATVALDLGGRLLSLHDLQADRELLYVNPVVQPANLALRNAWFSGGVEWNIGTRGHSPTTMDTLHAARVEGPDGEPMLRLWEWERLRGVVFQVDLWMPPSSRRAARPHPHPQPQRHCRCRCTGGRTRRSPPGRTPGCSPPQHGRSAPSTRAPCASSASPDDGDDVTFPSRHVQAADFFFDIGSGQRPWIAAVDGDGTGIAHVSTARAPRPQAVRLGNGPRRAALAAVAVPRWRRGVRRDPGRAGTDPVRAPHDAGAGRVELDRGVRRDRRRPPAQPRWALGRRSRPRRWRPSTSLVPVDQLDALAPSRPERSPTVPAETLATGSGWGALERLRREASGETWFDDAGTPFPDDSLGPDQEPWLELLRTGRLPSQPPDCPPRSYVVGGDWEARLAAAPPTWLTDYLRAVLAHGRGDRRTGGRPVRIVAASRRQRMGVARARRGRPRRRSARRGRRITRWRRRGWRPVNGGSPPRLSAGCSTPGDRTTPWRCSTSSPPTSATAVV